MEKLNKIIEQFGRWETLSIFISRIETHIESDFSFSIGNAKALLETIGKEICKQKQIELNENSSLNGILKTAFSKIGYSTSSHLTQISSALATIGQNINELRNDLDVTSHGKTLEEINNRNKIFDQLSREFLIDSVEIISCFLICSFENENPRIKTEGDGEILNYNEQEIFNEYWDDNYGEFEMGEYSYLASEILFYVDNQAYQSELNTYNLNQKIDNYS